MRPPAWRLRSPYSAGAPPPHLRRLLPERRVRERLQRIVERRELARQLEEVLVVVGAAVQLRELVADPVEALQQHVEAAIREALGFHAAHLRDASSSRERTTTASAPSSRSTSSRVPTAATLRAAPTCASAMSASSRGASVKTPIRTPPASS